MSIPAVKGVEIGAGFANAAVLGSQAHDPILPATAEAVALPRSSNRAGGIEGGMTNGQPVVVRAAMKPISTLRQPLPSVDLVSGEAGAAGYERADVCAVSAASVVAQAMVAFVLADALLARLGGETIDELADRRAAFAGAARRLGCGDSRKKGPDPA
jgi:chorismate synthase